MAISLKSEQVWLTAPGGDYSAQAVVEGTLALEEEVAQLVDLEVVPLLESVEVGEGKVIVRGSLDLNLLYQPQSGWGGLALVARRWQRCLPFEQEVEAPEAALGMEAKVSLATSEFRHEVHSGSLELSAMVAIELALVEVKEVSLATDALSVPPGQLGLEQKQIRYNLPLTRIRELSTADGVLILPGELSDLAKIIQSRLQVRATNLSLNQGEALIEGVMDLSLLYYTSAPEGVPPGLGSLDLRGVLPFHFVVPIPAFNRVQGNLELLVENYQLEPQSPREVAVTAQIVSDLELFEPRRSLVLTELRSKGELAIAQRKEQFQHQFVVGEETGRFSVQGGIVLPQGELPIAEVLRVEPFISSQTVRMVEEQVVVEAMAGFDLLYLVDEATAESPFRTVTFGEVLRIEQAIPIPGASGEMTPLCQLELEELGWELLDPASVRVRLGGKLKAKVIAVEELELLVEATSVTELADDISMVYYIVQAGDTPWKVASRYGQSVDALLAANLDVDFVPGSHLLILNGAS